MYAKCPAGWQAEESMQVDVIEVLLSSDTGLDIADTLKRHFDSLIFSSKEFQIWLKFWTFLNPNRESSLCWVDKKILSNFLVWVPCLHCLLMRCHTASPQSVTAVTKLTYKDVLQAMTKQHNVPRRFKSGLLENSVWGFSLSPAFYSTKSF